MNNIKYHFSPEENFHKLVQIYGESNPLDEQYLEGLLIASHGTSFKNAHGIFRDGIIKSYAMLRKDKPSIVSNSNLTTTDKLDISLGLHKYVFFSLGRATISELADTFLCFDFCSLSTIPGALASTIEIAECGGIVSDQAEMHYKSKGYSIKDILESNNAAKEMFFSNLIHAKDFIKIFNSFLRFNFKNYTDFVTSIDYPQELPSKSIVNSKSWRQGPQLMIPNNVPTKDNLIAVIDLFGRGQTMVDKGKIINLKTLIKESKINVNQFFSLLEERKSGICSDTISKYINYILFEIGNLRKANYSGNLQEGLLDLLKST